MFKFVRKAGGGGSRCEEDAAGGSGEEGDAGPAGTAVTRRKSLGHSAPVPNPVTGSFKRPTFADPAEFKAQLQIDKGKASQVVSEQIVVSLVSIKSLLYSGLDL